MSFLIALIYFLIASDGSR